MRIKLLSFIGKLLGIHFKVEGFPHGAKYEGMKVGKVVSNSKPTSKKVAVKSKKK